MTDVVIRAHEIALDLNNVEKTKFSRAAGCARVAYNWALERWGEQYAAWRDWNENGRVGEASPKPTEVSLRRELNAIKAEQFPWMYESTKCAPQEAIRALGVAFKNFFAGRAAYPAKKRWRTARRAFTVSSGQFTFDGYLIRVPNIGWVKMREKLRWDDARPLSVTFHERAGRWFASVRCEVPGDQITKPHTNPGTVVGVDLGVREYATSDGELMGLPRSYRANEEKLRRAQKSLSRRRGPDRRTGQVASNRWKRQNEKVRRIHRKTADIRKDWTHKLSNDIASRYETVVLEGLNVTGMTKYRRLSKSVLDANFAEFRRQIEYKTQDHLGRLILADRWFPSSKKCSTCGAVRTAKLSLSIRAWVCADCGATHHRDINAAVNLRDLAVSSTVTGRGALLAAVLPEQIARAGQAVATKRQSDSNAA